MIKRILPFILTIITLNIFGGIEPYTHPLKSKGLRCQQEFYDDEDFKEIIAIAELNKKELYLQDPCNSIRDFLVNSDCLCAYYRDTKTNQICGFVIYRPLGQEWGEVNYLAVAHQRKGIGTALLGYAKKELKKMGCSVVGICTGRTNDKARNCYIKNGFILDETSDNNESEFVSLTAPITWQPYVPSIGWQPYVLHSAKAGIALGASAALSYWTLNAHVA